MNRLLLIVLGFALAFNLVAANFEVDSLDKKISAGSTYIITWTETGGTPATPELLNINLLYGPSAKLQLKQPIIQGIPSKRGRYPWWISSKMNPSSQYVIEIGNETFHQYSHYFTITNPNMPSLSPYNSSASAPTSSSSTSDAKETSDKKNHHDSDNQNNNTTSVQKSSDNKSNGFLVSAGFIGVVGVITSLFM
ncbi:hypothetical protein K7432_002171 [Basidiobolus ranarum]|uniref:Yeast cell wall synthesis Kre9/Knh1-like N-terminal domain-containing protein n=1 Tax=Basidiobolus ranarum TaxID=34480 RepID=A0ABR2W8C4_9FUNG